MPLACRHSEISAVVVFTPRATGGVGQAGQAYRLIASFT
jgi:hypothetical protein